MLKLINFNLLYLTLVINPALYIDFMIISSEHFHSKLSFFTETILTCTEVTHHISRPYGRVWPSTWYRGGQWALRFPFLLNDIS